MATSRSKPQLLYLSRKSIKTRGKFIYISFFPDHQLFKLGFGNICPSLLVQDPLVYFWLEQLEIEIKQKQNK